MSRMRNLIVFLTMSLVGGVSVSAARQAMLNQQFQNTTDNSARLVGTWVYQTSDSYTFQRITLTLRADGTYTKTLEARVNGSPYGGTHEGNWTAMGTIVHLSGDGNWPAYSHDLSTFRREGR